MTDCSRDSNPPELLEEVGSRSRDWMLSLQGDVQKGVKGGGGNYIVCPCVCVESKNVASLQSVWFCLAIHIFFFWLPVRLWLCLQTHLCLLLVALPFLIF